MTDPIPPWPGEFVPVGAGDVFVRSAPAPEGAESALFVHGLGGSATNWTDLMDVLRNRPEDGPGAPPLSCEALDLPGFGYSPLPADGDYSLDARAAAVSGLIEKRGYWPVHLVGNSLGGAVSVRVAARRPDLVRTLTLISPALPDLRPRALPIRLTLLCAPGMGPWLLTRAHRISPEDRTSMVIRDIYADPSVVDAKRRAEDIAELIRRDGLGYADDVLLATARGLVAEYVRRGPRSLWRDAVRISAPTLVMYGSHDRLVRPAMAALAARAFRNARVVVLPQIGHVAMMERPDVVAREIRGMLAATRRPVHARR
ncbi:MAG TPA: alpha/beta fold hydrolase [Streptosporangiaceae bacterium]|jgi:pimeloyl-ACP methyl ester carboxylesterase|nr:alpha/beta fold hydrolase [Streptosporangiaceae bacterium]